MDAYSALTLNLVESTITGKINEANTAAKIDINLDEDSSIILTGNSYYTSMVNEKIDGANLVNETYKWTSSTEKEIKISSTNQGNGNNNNNNQAPGGESPNGQNGAPNGQPSSTEFKGIMIL